MTRLIAVCAVALIAAAGYFWLGGARPGAQDTALLIGSAEAQSAAEIDTSTVVEMALGAEDAPVTLIEYASFTCPHCAAFHQGPFKQLKADYIDTGKVRLIYRDVFFDRFGLWASMVARCEPTKFFGIADLIYKGQAEWTKAGEPTAIVAELRKIGRLAGLEDAALDACLQDGENAQTLVAWYQEHAEADDITGTPTFVLNGEKVTNRPYAELADLIDAELGE